MLSDRLKWKVKQTRRDTVPLVWNCLQEELPSSILNFLSEEWRLNVPFYKNKEDNWKLTV